MRNTWRISGVERQNVDISMALLAGITAFSTPTQSWHSTRATTEHHLAHAGAQVNELHVRGDRG